MMKTNISANTVILILTTLHQVHYGSIRANGIGKFTSMQDLSKKYLTKRADFAQTTINKQLTVTNTCRIVKKKLISCNT
jgi:hypothetical protein